MASDLIFVYIFKHFLQYAVFPLDFEIFRTFRLPNNSYKPITNTAGCTRLAAASDKVYQLLAHGREFSPGTPASSTTNSGRHDIAEILLRLRVECTLPYW
jgi:hypothetical protein